VLDLRTIRLMNEGDRGLIVITDDAERMRQDDIWRLIRGEMNLKSPITYRYHLGSKPLDLIETTFPARHLLSRRFVQALTAGGFTGWSTYPIRVLGKDGREIVGYHGFSITGKCGPVDWSRSERVDRAFRGSTKTYLRGVYFDETTWDGSDVFLVEGSARICVVQSVYEVLKPLFLTNVDFLPLSQEMVPMSVIPPHRLGGNMGAD